LRPLLPPQAGEAAPLAALVEERQRQQHYASTSGGGGGGGGGLRLQPHVTLEAVLAAGRVLAEEQQAVMDLQLAKQVRRVEGA
jgi:hypothetical protein